MGRLVKVRSRACQIGVPCPRIDIQIGCTEIGRWRIGKLAEIPARSTESVRRNGPKRLRTWHRTWKPWSRFSAGPAFWAERWCGRCASAITAFASRCGGRSSRVTFSRSARSDKSTRSRPTCATRPRSRPRCVMPMSPSTSSASWRRRGAQTFDAVQAEGADTIAKTAAAAGARMVHVSAIGADVNSTSRYARSKAAGEAAVLSAVPSATILRPSVVFGPEDDFTNRFAALARISPALPLIGGGLTKLQPVYVGDVATAVADAVDGKTKAGANLRTRRTGSAVHARDHGDHPFDHRTRPHAGVVAVRDSRNFRRCCCSLRPALSS